MPVTLLQTQTTECGLASMAMILGHFGRFVTLEELRRVSGVSRDCVNAADLVRIAKHYGLAVRVLRREPEELSALGFPLVVYLNFIHFVVVENVTEEGVDLNDPACGRHRMSREEFHEKFTGIALTFSATADFQPGGQHPDFFASVRRYLAGSGTQWLVIAMLAACLMTVPAVLFAWFLGGALEQLAASPAADINSLWLALSGLLFAVALRAGLQLLQRGALAQLELQLCRERLPALVKHLLSLPYAFFVYRIPAVLHGRIYDQELVNKLLCQNILPAACSLPALLLSLAALFYYDVVTGYTITALTAAYLVLLALIFQGEAGSLRCHREQDEAAWTKLSQALRNFESFKTGGGNQEFFSGSMGGSAGALKLRQEYGWFLGWSELLPDLFAGLMLLAVLVCTYFGMHSGDFGFGGFIAMLVLVAALLEPLRTLASLHGKLDTLRRVLPPIEDLREQLTPPIEQTESVRQESPHILNATNISFGFTRVKPPLLKDISLAIAAGEQIGITGPSGGGKSTLAEMLIGLHRPWNGEILLEGKQLSSLPATQLSRDIAWVNKHPFFFAGTVRENLCLWREDISEEHLHAALRDACLEEVLEHCPAGLDTPVAPRAANFSGGQRQRMEIARALLCNPRILVLDEATDGLDHALEQRLRANLKRRGLTLIVVSHRLSTLAACDRVLRLAGGRLVTDDACVEQVVPAASAEFSAEEDPVPPPRPPGDRREALIQVFRRVAQAVGEREVTLPPQPIPAEGQGAEEQGLYALARHNRIPVRHVRFVVSKWWQRDHGPLIAFTREGKRPLAVLPGAGGTYMIFDPANDTQEQLTPAIARNLESRAYMLYARFAPAQPRHLAFFLHAFDQLRPDLRTASIASLALAALATGTPVAAYALFAEVLPFADGILARQWQAGLVWLALALVAGESIRLLAMLRIEGRLDSSAASALYQHVMRLQALFFREHSPEEIARSLNCVPRVLELLRHGKLRRLSGGLTALAGVAVIAWFSGALAVAALALLLPLPVVPALLMRAGSAWVHPHFALRLDGLQFLFQMFKSAPHLRQAGREQAALAHWMGSYAAESEMAGRIRRTEVYAQSFADAYPWLALAGFVWIIAAWGSASVAVLAAVMLAYMLAVFAAQGFASALADVVRALPLLDRLTPLAAAPLEPLGAVPDQAMQSESIEIRGLTFTYPGSDTPTLNGVSMRIAPGQFVALAGPSGSGKSTLLRLLLGFYAADAGGIFRNGEPHLESNLSAWREQIGAVLQDDQLEIAMSIRGHIMGNAACTMAEIREAARLAMLEPDIDAMPMGIQSIVDSDKVSTGQKQRILIAHRLLRRPKFLILDEATNALPENVQAELLAKLRQLGMTCLLVTHRASTIAAADHVYLMDDGRISWSGTPQEFAAAGLAPVMREEEDESE